MTRRFLWLPVLTLVVVSLLTSTGRGPSTAAAGPKPAPPPAACRDDLGRTQRALADAQAEIARLKAEQVTLRAQVDSHVSAERTRVAKLQAQLGAPMIEKLP